MAPILYVNNQPKNKSVDNSFLIPVIVSQALTFLTLNSEGVVSKYLLVEVVTSNYSTYNCLDVRPEYSLACNGRLSAVSSSCDYWTFDIKL